MVGNGRTVKKRQRERFGVKVFQNIVIVYPCILIPWRKILKHFANIDGVWAKCKYVKHNVLWSCDLFTVTQCAHPHQSLVRCDSQVNLHVVYSGEWVILETQKMVTEHENVHDPCHIAAVQLPLMNNNSLDIRLIWYTAVGLTIKLCLYL